MIGQRLTVNGPGKNGTTYSLEPGRSYLKVSHFKSSHRKQKDTVQSNLVNWVSTLNHCTSSPLNLRQARIWRTYTSYFRVIGLNRRSKTSSLQLWKSTKILKICSWSPKCHLVCHRPIKLKIQRKQVNHCRDLTLLWQLPVMVTNQSQQAHSKL
jgi:hypothetical protein